MLILAAALLRVWRTGGAADPTPQAARSSARCARSRPRAITTPPLERLRAADGTAPVGPRDNGVGRTAAHAGPAADRRRRDTLRSDAGAPVLGRRRPARPQRSDAGHDHAQGRDSPRLRNAARRHVPHRGRPGSGLGERVRAPRPGDRRVLPLPVPGVHPRRVRQPRHRASRGSCAARACRATTRSSRRRPASAPAPTPSARSGSSTAPASTPRTSRPCGQSLGAGRVALWGTSYGTKLAVAYALAHPGQRRPPAARLGRADRSRRSVPGDLAARDAEGAAASSAPPAAGRRRQTSRPTWPRSPTGSRRSPRG